ncbi:twin-arginine translocation signal domain-containing protein [Shewanella woodyi]
MKRRDFIAAGGIAVASTLFAPHLLATTKGSP